MFWLFRRPGPIRVVDADTIERDGVSYRLMGFDAPETKRAASEHEWAIGQRATARLTELLAPPNKVKLEPTKESDRFKRRLARVYINGRDVAEIAIEERWGIPFHGEKRKQRPDWSTWQY